MGFFRKKQANNEKPLGNYDLEHILGLDIPENIPCSVRLYLNKLIIKSSGVEYSLDLIKIKSCDFKMDIDVKQYTKSSLAKGLVGGLTFGVPGAIAFSSPKSKEKREVKGYAIINYQNSNNEYTYLILKDSYSNSNNAAKLVDKLRGLTSNSDSKKVNL